MANERLIRMKLFASINVNNEHGEEKRITRNEAFSYRRLIIIGVTFPVSLPLFKDTLIKESLVVMLS